MKKIFLLIPVLAFALMTKATAPTITIDGDKSDWAEVPMLSEPGAWPMLKVLPAADAELGTNALVYMMENNVDFDPTWTQYPTEFIDKDYDKSTEAIAEYWAFPAMGVDYKATTGVTVGEDWISFPKAISSDNKVIELGFPATYITDLGNKFGFAMYYNSGAWFCPDYSSPAVSPSNGFLYKTRSFTTVAGTTTLTTANVFAHQSIGEVGAYVDFGLRDNGNDTARWAAFPIELTAPAVYDVITNVSSTNSWKFEFWLVDVETNAIVAHIDAPESSVSSSKTSYNFGSLDLRAVPAGKYMLKAKNRVKHSTVKLNSIDLIYAGGAVVNVPGTLNINDAVITNGKRQDGVIKFDNALTGIAEWKIAVASAAAVDVTLTIKNQYGHNLTVSIFEEDGVTPVDAVSEGGNKYTNNVDGLDIELGSISLAAGNYVLKVTNATDGSDAKIASLALTYVGGAVQNMPGTTAINDAWFSANGTRTGGAIEYTSVGSGCWAKWNIAVANHAWYDVVVNIKGQYGHDFTVEFLKEGETTPIVVTKNATNYSNDLTLYANDLGLVELEAANYEMKVSNSVGDAAIISVTLAYSGGNVINVSPSANTTLPVADAWFTSTCVREDGKIEFKSDNANSWIKWNIATSATAFYDITVNIEAPNAHEFAVAIYEDENASPVASFKESFDETTGSLALELGKNINLTGGKNYVVKVTNVPSGSKSKLLNVVFAPVVPSSTITLPATLDFNDAVLSSMAHITAGELWFNEIGDSNPVGQWAQWEVTVDHNGTYLFSMAVSSTNSQSYRISILDSGNNEVAVYDKNPGGSGDKTIQHYFYLETGTYFIKVENTHSWSQGHLVSLVVSEPSLLSLDQNATSAPDEAAVQNIQIMRTFVGGMYNTICLPFGVGGSKLREAFGSDVILKKLNTAEFDETSGILDLNFEDQASSGIYQGTPYLIKPSQDVVNPVFESVEILSTTHAGTTERNYANFVGTFVATEIPAGENNLFLGPNDYLYFSPDAATPVKGFRAWFVVHDIPGGAKAIKRARIIERENVITVIDFVKESQNTNVQKRLENGRVVIIRNGELFTVQGQRIQ